MIQYKQVFIKNTPQYLLVLLLKAPKYRFLIIAFTLVNFKIQRLSEPLIKAGNISFWPFSRR